MDRRAFPRIAHRWPVDVEVQLLGPGFRIESFQAEGATINVSRAGMLLRLDRSLPKGTVCSIALHGPKAGGGRVDACVVHARSAPSGWEVGFRLDGTAPERDVPASLQRDSTGSFERSS